MFLQINTGYSHSNLFDLGQISLKNSVLKSATTEDFFKLVSEVFSIIDLVDLLGFWSIFETYIRDLVLNMKTFLIRFELICKQRIHEPTWLTVSSIKPISTGTVITIYFINTCSSVLTRTTCTFVDVWIIKREFEIWSNYNFESLSHLFVPCMAEVSLYFLSHENEKRNLCQVVFVIDKIYVSSFISHRLRSNL